MNLSNETRKTFLRRYMTMENREKILKKIENLLSLAGNNPSENEAIAAALKAQELMAKYNIEFADVEGKGAKDTIGTETYMPKKNCHYVRKWRYTLSQIIAKNFCCKTYSVNREAIVFYGYEKDAKIAAEVFGFLFETGNKLANRYYLKCKKEGRETKGVLNTYLVGFCEGIREVLDKQCTALMIVTPKEVEEAYEEYSKNFRTCNNRLSISSDKRAYSEGKADGKATATARGIEG
jgi:hypothetical protein